MPTARSLHELLHRSSVLAPFVVFLMALLMFSVWDREHFLTITNLTTVVQQVMVVGTLALGQSLVILTAGIDLSVGAIMVVTSILMGKLSAEQGLPGWLALVIGLAAGAGCGLINGALIVRLKLPPFIVTLGSYQVFFALNLYLSHSQTILGENMGSILTWTGGQAFTINGSPIPWGTLMMIALFCVFAYVLGGTAWGRHVYATGDDVEAARLAGVRTDRVLLSVYTVAGLLCAIGAWMLIGRIGSASPQAGQTENLASITAVVIGGISLFGGRGKVLGVLFGALIVGVFQDGLVIVGVDTLWVPFVIGILVIVAVAADQRIRKVQA